MQDCPLRCHIISKLRAKHSKFTENVSSGVSLGCLHKALPNWILQLICVLVCHSPLHTMYMHTPLHLIDCMKLEQLHHETPAGPMAAL